MDFQTRPTDDGSDTLYSEAYKQIFHSTRGALTETLHVFLEGTAIDRRLASGQSTRVLEVGFGTGLNFFVTAQMARLANAPLHFVSLEKQLLTCEVLAQLNHSQVVPEIKDLREEFFAWRDALPDPLPPRLWWEYSDELWLEIILGDATMVDIPNLAYHAIFQDAFSPEANPELWTEAFLRRLFPLLLPGGRLATYSAKGVVRRALQQAGFVVSKRPGPPGKREMLVAVR